MVNYEKENGIMNMIKYGLGCVSQLVSASIFSQVADGTEVVMNRIDDKIIQVEKRIQRKMYSFMLILFGGVFLVFAIFSFLKEVLGQSNTLAFFSIGITIFVTGLLLKVGEYERRRNG